MSVFVAVEVASKQVTAVIMWMESMKDILEGAIQHKIRNMLYHRLGVRVVCMKRNLYSYSYRVKMLMGRHMNEGAA
jgi:hypothetical protein